jgi:hypothetical protein
MRFKLSTLFAVFLALSTAVIDAGGQGSSLTLRSVMSQREYAASGISGLSPAQQNVIDVWLNHWTTAAMTVSCGGTYSNTGERQSIEENADGRILILDDDSLWLVESVDRVDSSLWLSTEDVIVIDAKHPVAGFKYMIINTEDKEQVLAKYLGQD